MYVKDTLNKYVISIIPDLEDIYHFDNGNGTTGFRVITPNRVTRKQIDAIEKKTDLFLTHIDTIEGPHAFLLELEFLSI
jgi:hypothetical protein